MRLGLTSTLLMASLVTVTTQSARADWGFPEPVKAVSSIDVKLQAYEDQINDAYINGLLDPMELAELEREILAARDVEAESKSDIGLVPSSYRHVKKYVDRLGYLINGHITGNTPGTFVSVMAEPTCNQYPSSFVRVTTTQSSPNNASTGTMGSPPASQPLLQTNPPTYAK